MTQSQNPFSTDHLYLAAFLVCRGHSLAGTEANGTGRISFLFSSSNAVRSAAADFMSGGQIDARQFAFAILRLKRSLPQQTTKTVKRIQYVEQSNPS
jgi:hypothetical protein